MADLKIGITADASNAIKGIDSLSNSYAKLGKQLNEGNKLLAVPKTANDINKGFMLSNDAFDKLQDKISRTLVVYKTLYSEQEALSKSVAFLESKSFNLANTYTLTGKQVEALKSITAAYRSEQEQLNETLTRQNRLEEYALKAVAVQQQMSKSSLKVQEDAEKYSLKIFKEAEALKQQQQAASAKAVADYNAKMQELYQSTEEIIPVTQKWNNGLEGTAKITDKFGMKLISIAKNIVVFRTVMQFFNKIINGIGTTLRDSVNVAAEAQQVYSKLSTVFDGLSTSMDRANALAAQLGVSTKTAASALSTVGDLLQAQGATTSESLEKATEWVEKFQDIIAFKDINMTLEEFAQNFMSGAAGNLRNFRTFGSIVKESAVQAKLAEQGMDGLTGSALEYQKMIIRANMALEQQANAMGATEREWDTILSIQRRLNEAWSEWKENLGNTLNRVITPIKERITEILEKANEANNLADRMEGKTVADVYTGDFDKNNSANVGLILQELGALVSSAQSGSSIDTFGLLNAMNTTGAKSIDVSGIFLKEFALEEEMMIAIEKIIYEVGKSSKTMIDLQKLREKEYTASEKALDRYGSLLDTLSGIMGAGTISTYAGYEDANIGVAIGSSNFANLLAEDSIKAIETAFNSIKSSDLTEFADAVAVSLGTATEEDMKKNRVDSIVALYTAAWNEFYADGVLESRESAMLEKIKKFYQDITAVAEEVAVPDYSNIQGVIGNYQKSIADRKARAGYAAQGFDEGEIDIFMGRRNAIQEAMDLFADLPTGTLIPFGDEMYSLVGILGLINEEYQQQYQDYLNGLPTTTLDWGEITGKFPEMFGEMGTLFTLGQGNEEGNKLFDLANLGMSILSQLEIVGRVSTLISDTVVPLLDAFFAPLVIIMTPLTKMLQNVLSLVLQFLFPIIQGLALGINNIVLAINIIVDILKFNWKKVSEDMDEWKQTRNEILAANLETASNTSRDSELAVYKDLYERKLLNANEFAGEAARIGYDYGPLGGSSSGWAVSGGTTYYYDNMSITIDASGYSKEELRELIEEIARPGSTGFGNN